MKLNKIITIAACGLMFAACSNETPVVNSEKNLETGYAAFNVNLPTAAGSRAESFAEGDASEYAVRNGRVILFEKADNELNAKYICTGELSGMNWGAAQAGEVTTSTTSLARLDNIDLADSKVQYGALVVLNYAPDFTFPAEGQTLGQWIKTAQSSGMILTSGSDKFITMTSAPRYEAGKEPVLLADVNKAMILQTEAQAAAQSEPACTVFVQRNLAKVSVVNSFNGNISVGTYTGDKVDVTAWGLDITNRTSFPVQVTAGLSASYADIWNGGAKLNRFGGNGTKFQRCYWALDPNYDKNITDAAAVNSEFYTISDVNSMPASLYALENTFDIDHQMQGQTTRVIVKGVYTPAGFTKGDTFFKLGSINELWSLTTLTEHIKSVAAGQQNSANISVTLPESFSKGGLHALTEVKILNGSDQLSDADYAQVALRLGIGSATEKIIATYEGGESYYVARVKHFGDADTPWTIGNPTYDGDNLNYLGRYGMVRNNWYEVNINSISNPGHPAVPEIDFTAPDDENDYYIAVSVNVLSWAKRVHTTDL